MHDEDGKRCGVGVKVSMGCTMLAATLAGGCTLGVPEAGTDEVGAAAAAILGGSAAAIPAMGALEGSLHESDSVVHHCTAALVAPDVAITAAHCVVRSGGYSAYDRCQPWANARLGFVASDGARYPIDLDNRRIYVPGQSFEQLTSLELDSLVEVGECVGGAHNEDYYGLHPWEDVALVGLLPDVEGSLPTATPVTLWDASSAEVEAVLGGSFEWAGTAYSIPLKFDAEGGMQYSGWPGPLCSLPNVAILAPGNQQFFFKDIECGEQGSYQGLMQGGDSGGPLFVQLGAQKLLAGVASSYAAKSTALGGCPDLSPHCDPGDLYLNIWSSVPSQLSFINQALEWATNDYDADGVTNEDDNCPLHPNAPQANANRDYEVAVVGHEQQGDACDPSPVAEPLAGDAISATTAEWYANCTPDESTTPEDCILRRDTHDVELWTAWAPEQPDATEDAATGVRYCICRDGDGVPIRNVGQCAAAYGCALNNLEFAKSEGLEDTQTRWLRITARGRSGGASVTYAAGAQLARTIDWNWELDAPRWKDEGFWQDPASPPPGPTGPFIAGLMWGHNDSVTGSDDHLGLPHGSCQEVDAQCGFGNSYTFWDPWKLVYACPRLPANWPIVPLEDVGAAVASAGEPDAPAEQRFVPEPSRVLGIPLVSRSAGFGELPFEARTVAGVRVEPGFATPCESSDGLSVAQLSVSSGARQIASVVDEALSPELRDLLLQRDDLMWLWPTEPVELGGPRAGPFAVALKRATGLPVAFVAPDGQGRLRSTARPQSALATAFDEVPPVLGPTAYSRSRRELVQLRGSTAAEPLDSVVIMSLSGSGIERALEPSSLRPAAAVAAAYNPSAMRMWVVGCRESTDCSSGPLELYVIDAPTGRILSVREFLPSLRRFWLASSGSGEMTLVATSEQAASYLVAVFDADEPGVPGDARLSGAVVRAGRVIGPGRASADVLLVPVSKPQAKAHPEQPSLYHVDAIPLSEVRGRVRGACFAGPDEP